jgi:hypothetical protein
MQSYAEPTKRQAISWIKRHKSLLEGRRTADCERIVVLTLSPLSVMWPSFSDGKCTSVQNFSPLFCTMTYFPM